jgi:hypothetical protein
MASFAQMGRDTGLDVNSQQKDPLFVNRGTLYGSTARAAFDANGEVDRLSVADYRALIAEGYDVAFRREFTKTWNYFAVDPGSPAVTAGAAIPQAWPETQPRRTGAPLGAGPVPAL